MFLEQKKQRARILAPLLFLFMTGEINYRFLLHLLNMWCIISQTFYMFNNSFWDVF